MNLQEIREAVRNYLDSKVTVSISMPQAVPPPSPNTAIDPTDKFKFKITVQNADAASGGMPLKNVIYYVKVADPSIGKLYPSAVHTCKSSLNSSTKLDPTQLYPEMYIFPSPLLFLQMQMPRESRSLETRTERPRPAAMGNVLEMPEMLVAEKPLLFDFMNALHIGDTDSIELTGEAIKGGWTSIEFKIFADPDLDWLFPKGEDSQKTSAMLFVRTP